MNLEDYIYLGKTPIAKASGQDLYFIHVDHLNMPVVMTDIGGASVWNLEVRPFGDSENVTGTATLNLRFPGQYYDNESGMNYNYFRTYRPELGRYMEADPVGLAGGTPNLYEYAFNNPITWIDPLGLSGEESNCPKCDYDNPDDAAKAWFGAPYQKTGRSNWSASMSMGVEVCTRICKKGDCYFWTPTQRGTNKPMYSSPMPRGYDTRRQGAYSSARDIEIH